MIYGIYCPALDLVQQFVFYVISFSLGPSCDFFLLKYGFSQGLILVLVLVYSLLRLSPVFCLCLGLKHNLVRV